MTRVIEVRRCSITEGGTDCVVNASNEQARLGGGVSRALFLECGGAVLQDEMTATLQEEFDGRLEEGDCMVTSAGTSTRLRHVLHVPAVDYSGTRARLNLVGGVERTVTSVERLKVCTESALRAAIGIAEREGSPMSVTFPLLGAGSGGTPAEAAFRAMLDGVRAVLRETPGAPVARIVFAVPEADRFQMCERQLQSWLTS